MYVGLSLLHAVFSRKILYQGYYYDPLIMVVMPRNVAMVCFNLVLSFNFRRAPPSKMENTLREYNLRGCHFFSQSKQSYDSPRGNRRNRSRGGHPGCSSQPLRGIMILFHWLCLKFLPHPPLPNSKTTLLYGRANRESVAHSTNRRFEIQL